MTVRLTKRLPYNTDQIVLAMRDRYMVPEWALFFEVGNGTGFSQRRWADAVAMNCFPSRGLEIHGFEFKVSRSDWSAELRNPDKSEPVQRYCDRWWVVTPEELVQPEEMPATWGLLWLKDKKLRQAVAAPKLTPQPITREFMASVLRSSARVGEAALDSLIQERIAKIEADANKQVERELAHRKTKADGVIEKAEKLKELTGIDLVGGWTPNEDVAAAIKFALKADLADSYSGIQDLRRRMVVFLKNLDEAMVIIGQKPEGESSA